MASQLLLCPTITHFSANKIADFADRAESLIGVIKLVLEIVSKILISLVWLVMLVFLDDDRYGVLC